jgi:hypothetical protein
MATAVDGAECAIVRTPENRVSVSVAVLTVLAVFHAAIRDISRIMSMASSAV